MKVYHAVKIKWIVVVLAMAGLVGAWVQPALAASDGYLGYGDDVDWWRLRGNVIDYIGDRIEIVVDPGYTLDVEVCLYLAYYDLSGGLRVRRLLCTDRYGKGGIERIIYCVYSRNFSFTELMFGRLVIGVWRESGSGFYGIRAHTDKDGCYSFPPPSEPPCPPGEICIPPEPPW